MPARCCCSSFMGLCLLFFPSSSPRPAGVHAAAALALFLKNTERAAYECETETEDGELLAEVTFLQIPDECLSVLDASSLGI